MVGEEVTGERLIGTAQDLPEPRPVQHGTGVVGYFLLGGEGKSSEAVAHRHHLTKRQQKPTRQRGRSPASTRRRGGSPPGRCRSGARPSTGRATRTAPSREAARMPRTRRALNRPGSGGGSD